MIVGIAALLSILFFGGANEVFLVDKIEKGVKETIIEPDRKKEILSDLKSTKKYITKYNKGRNKQFGSFTKMYKLESTSENDLNSFFEELDTPRQGFLSEVIDDRVSILQKIEDDEWKSILEFSGQTVDRRKEKTFKKTEKNGSTVIFGNTKIAIAKVAKNESEKEVLMKGLQSLTSSFESFGNKILSINVRENDVLIQKDASKNMLLATQNELNDERKKCFAQLINFRNTVKKNCDADQWKNIMKAFTKELSMSLI